MDHGSRRRRLRRRLRRSCLTPAGYPEGIVAGVEVVVIGMVATVEVVLTGMEVDDVGGTVVVVSGVCVVVVWGGCVVAGAVVPGLDGALVTTGPRVVAVVAVLPPPAGAKVVGVLTSTVVDGVDVELDETPEDVVVGRAVVVGPAVVVDDPWLATCWRNEASSPVTTSNSSAARATDASA